MPLNDCARCNGTGEIAYPSTAGPFGGMGGQMFTAFPCPDCCEHEMIDWGNGANRCRKCGEWERR